MTAFPIAWADPARANAFGRWLAAIAPQHSLRAETVRPASADASFRRYFRVDSTAGTASYIIMDAPPAQEDCKPFVKVAGLMLEAGLNAPRVLAWEEALGFMLLSDLGAQTMLDLIEPPAAVDAIAQPTSAHFDLDMDAVDTLVRWQLASQPGVLPPYDEALLSRELALFPEWYVAQYRGFALNTGLQDKLDGLFTQIKASNLQSLGGARVYVHRDFMPRNLMAPTLVASRTALPPEGAVSPWGGPAAKPEGGPRLGVLDFQDAVYGPITYDIASLMRDAFLSWDEDFCLDVTIRYWEKARKAGLPVGADFGEFYRAVEWMGLQRHLKVAGIFARLTLRDGKPQYLADTPRFITYIRTTCTRYRELKPLLRLIDKLEGTQAATGFAFGRV